MSRILRTVVPALLVVLTAGCNHYREYKLSTFDAAMAVPQKVSDPPVVMTGAFPADFPGSAPYVELHGDFDGNPSISEKARKLKREALQRGFAPDALVIQDHGSAYAGSVTNHVGFGVFMSTPVYRAQTTAICLRLSPASLGIRWNAARMVETVTDYARASGIQEGDTIVSVDGDPVGDPGQQSPLQLRCLGWQPDQEVTVVWIRPGTGRMEGKHRLGEPRPMPAFRSVSADAEESLARWRAQNQ